MSSRSGSSRRKPERPGHVTPTKRSQKVEVIDSDSEVEENGVGEDDIDDLPEGTVVVNPEPVDESSEDEAPARRRPTEKSAFAISLEMNKLMSRVLCTSCGKQANPNNPGAVRRHPWLKVVVCKKCYKFLKSGPFTKDDDGLDEQCRWCGEGGRLYGCDYCHNAFCRPCIKRNLGRSEAAKFESDDNPKWRCYMCSPMKLKDLVENCNKILDYIDKQERKEQASEDRRRERERLKKEERHRAREAQKSINGDKHDRGKKTETNNDTSKSSVPAKKFLPAPKSREKVIVIDSPDKKVSNYVKVEDSKMQAMKSILQTNVPKKEVVVLPRGPQTVTMPYKPIQPKLTGQQQGFNTQPFAHQNTNSSAGNRPVAQTNRPMLQNMLLNNDNTPSRGVQINSAHVPMNDLNDLKSAIFPYNVDTSTEQLSTVVQSLNLTLNSIKTDMAIAKLSNSNLFNARTNACNSLKIGMHVFLNSLREIFQVQFVTNLPSNKTAVKIEASTSNTSTPVSKQAHNIKRGDLDVSTIPINLDDTKDITPEQKDSTKDKKNSEADTEGSCMIVSDNEDGDDLIVMEVGNESEEDESEGEVVEIDDEDEVNDKTQEVKEEKSLDSKTDDDSKTSVNEDESLDDKNSEKDEKEMSMDEDNEKDSESEAEGRKLDEKKKSKGDDKDKTKGENREKRDEKQKASDEKAETNDKRKGTKKAKDEQQESDNDSDESEVATKTKESKNNDSRRKKSNNDSKSNESEKEISKDSKSRDAKKDSKSKESDKSLKDKSDKSIAKTKDSGKEVKGSRKDSTDSTSSLNKSSSPSKKGDTNENTAAELELLQEMAEEINERNEKQKEEGDLRRSSRTRSPQKSGKTEDEGKDKSDTSKSDKKTKSSDSSKKSEHDDKSDKKKSKSDIDSKSDRKKSKSDSISEGKKSKSEVDSKSESKTSKSDVDTKSEGKKSESDGKRSKPEADSKSEAKKSKSDVESKSEGKKSKSEVEAKSESKTSKSDVKSEGKKSESDGKRSKSEADSKSEAKKSKSDVESKSEGKKSKSEVEAKSEGKKSKSEAGSKKSKEKEASPDPDEEENKKDSDSSSDTDSEDVSEQEFGKRRRKRKESPKKSKKKFGKGKSGGKDKAGDSAASDEDSDPGFDRDLEKEIEALAKETKLTRRGRKAAEDALRDSRKKEKTEKKKPGKGKKKEEEEELSSGTDVEPTGADDVEEQEDSDEEENLSPAQLRKLRAARDAAEAEEEDDDDNVDEDMELDSSDPEISFPKMKTPKKGKKKEGDDSDVESDDSDFVTPKKRPRLRTKLLDVKVSDSDSEVDARKKKGKKGRRKKKSDSEVDSEDEMYPEARKKKGKKGKGRKRKKKSDSEADSEDEVYSDTGKGKGKKRRRIRKIQESSEEEQVKEPGEEDDLGSDVDDDGTPGVKRKKIRKVMKNKKLTDETKAARKAEDERRKRISDRQKEFNSYVEVEGAESDGDLPEGVEREHKEVEGEEGEKDKDEESSATLAKIMGSPKKVPVTTKCILEMDKDKKKPLIEIDRTLVRKLKPHQIDAVRFMFNCTFESIERAEKKEGAGCIVAHCMGLGKTLSVITYVHTMLRSVKYTKMSKCLVVCPLNTVLNWVNELEIWLEDVDFEIDVYELSSVKQNFDRAKMLKEWHDGGAGVMILGYEMYRNLVQGSHCKNKKQKKVFFDTLVDPGPDIVVCDEGHILKNDATTLAKSMDKVKTPLRIVLTGTPLQNNLGEYHCMVSFVKPSLMGTRKEFLNRFVNPITNGQCSDSTPFDVKLMKRRAHILHEMLAGCVQRKDYSALTKFLPPKHEYVVSVRLSTMQMDLYEKYLERGGMNEEVQGKGARLFKDYQALMRIWTHPWVMKLDEVRQANKMKFDDEDEDSFIDDSDSENDSFIDDSGSNSNDDKTSVSDGSSSGSGEGKKKKADKEEVVHKWKTRSRRNGKGDNEEGAGCSVWEDKEVDMGYKEKPDAVSDMWWADYIKEDDQYKLELGGKLKLLFEILKMCEDIGDKVLVFSQSLLSLNIIEDFLHKVDEDNQTKLGDDLKKLGDDESEADGNDKGDKKDEKDEKKDEKEGDDKKDGEKLVNGDAEKDAKDDKFSQYGKSWSKGLDYFRMDGSTAAQNRRSAQDMFNEEANYRARLFLISTKAGSLGVNLVGANRVIIFDASWNPSHDIQSIFRVYRFGQVKPVYVYRFLAQGTMEEKIYERQVTKQSLSQRVIDEHQIERHFSANDLQELYKFTPDRLDDPNRKERLPMLPQDHMLAELMTTSKEWIVTFHEHDSLLENVISQELTEDEKKAAWEEYEEEKKGRVQNMYGGQPFGQPFQQQQYAQQGPNIATMNLHSLMLQGQSLLGPNGVLQIVQDLKNRFPDLPPQLFQQRVQAVLRQVLSQQIMQRSAMERSAVEQQRMAELERLNQIKQQIARQQQVIATQQRGMGIGQGMMNMAGVSAIDPVQLQLMQARQKGTASPSNFNQKPS